MGMGIGPRMASALRLLSVLLASSLMMTGAVTVLHPAAGDDEPQSPTLGDETWRTRGPDDGGLPEAYIRMVLLPDNPPQVGVVWGLPSELIPWTIQVWDVDNVAEPLLDIETEGGHGSKAIAISLPVGARGELIAEASHPISTVLADSVRAGLVFEVTSTGLAVPPLSPTVSDGNGEPTLLERVEDMVGDPVGALSPSMSLMACSPWLEEVRYKTSNASSVPAGLREKPIANMIIQFHDLGGTVRSNADYTDATGLAELTIYPPSGACSFTGKFWRYLVFQNSTGDTVIEVHSPPHSGGSGGLYVGYSELDYTIAPPGSDSILRYNLIINTTQSVPAYMLQESARGYIHSDAAGHQLDRLAKIIWRFGVGSPSGCDPACYIMLGGTASSPDKIELDGSALWVYEDNFMLLHEYGHHAQANLMEAFATNALGHSDYGSCSAPCHFRESLHGHPGSAFKEGWANFFALAIRNNPNSPVGDFSLAPEDQNFDGRDANKCYGPRRECAVAGGMWQAYTSSAINRDLAPFLDTMSANGVPPGYSVSILDRWGVHQFRDTWRAQGLPHLTELDDGLTYYHVPPDGDAHSWSDLSGGWGRQHIANGTTVGALDYEIYMGNGTGIQEQTDGQDDQMRYNMNNTVSGLMHLDFVLTPKSSTETMELRLVDGGGTVISASTVAGPPAHPAWISMDLTAASNFNVDVLGVGSGHGLYDLTIGDLGGCPIGSPGCTTVASAGPGNVTIGLSLNPLAFYAGADGPTVDVSVGHHLPNPTVDVMYGYDMQGQRFVVELRHSGTATVSCDVKVYDNDSGAQTGGFSCP